MMYRGHLSICSHILKWARWSGFQMTGMYHELTKLEQFWNSTSEASHCIPCIRAVQALSYLSWLFLNESENNLSSWVYVLVCQCTGTVAYQYVRPWGSRTALYRVVPVRTVCTDLPNPPGQPEVSRYYRIQVPDESYSIGIRQPLAQLQCRYNVEIPRVSLPNDRAKWLGDRHGDFRTDSESDSTRR